MEVRLGKVLLLVLLGLGLQSCYYLQSSDEAMRTLFYAYSDYYSSEPAKNESVQARQKDLLILLPGIRDYPESFQKHEFMDSLRLHGPPMDVMAVNAHYGYYAKRNLLVRLEADVIEPARLTGYERFHFAGISLGGYGILLYMREHPQSVSSALLLAPYLGEPEHYAYLLSSHSLPSSASSITAMEDDANIWPWLTALDADQRSKIHLGYGRSDSYAESHDLLARHLPEGHVMVMEGDHGWGTWERLWPRLLAKAQLSKFVETREASLRVEP